MRNLVSELQRRNVLRVAAAYALVAWIIIEAGSVLLPTFGATTATFQVYVVIVLVGFVISLVCAWVFEITPEGVRLDSHVDRDASSPEKSGRAMNYAIMALLVVALVVSLAFNVTDLEDDVPLAAFAYPAIRDSIAVLPFTSRSTGAENRLFADGIHDDLLTKLANTGVLKVISRTSVLEYRDTQKNLRQIGQELGVDTVLEGAVQKVGDDVRINVQLIDAKTDEHLWAHTYDRQLTMKNIFAIQSEIAGAITDALKMTLVPAEENEAETLPTENLRAYSLYVSGRDNLYLRRLGAAQTARRQFEQAIELDPNYAEAYIGLAEAVLLLHINDGALPAEDAYRRAQENLDAALAINPDLADAYATLGLLKTSFWRQTRTGTENLEAEVAFERAISLNPNHAQAYMWFASLRSEEQRIEDAIAYYHRSLQLDPLGRVPLSNLPTLYARLGQNDIALKLWLDGIGIHPEWPTPYGFVAEHLFGLGRLDEAIAWQHAAQELSADPTLGVNVVFGIYLQFGEFDRVRGMLSVMPANHPLTAYAAGLNNAVDRDYHSALEAFSYNIDNNPQDPVFILDIAADIALLAGDWPKAREYILAREPLLAGSGELPVDPLTVRSVVKLAFTLLREGEKDRATKLLEQSLAVVATMPRLGMFGHAILDVQILTLLDRHDDALATLKAAINSGFRSSFKVDNWVLEFDPFLVPLRDDPRFTAMVARLSAFNSVMHERVKTAEKSGNWKVLTALAGPL